MAGTRLYITLSFFVLFALLVISSYYFGLVMIRTSDIDNDDDSTMISNDPFFIYLFHQGGRGLLMKEQHPYSYHHHNNKIKNKNTTAINHGYNIGTRTCTTANEVNNKNSISSEMGSCSFEESENNDTDDKSIITVSSSSVLRIVSSSERVDHWQSTIDRTIQTLYYTYHDDINNRNMDHGSDDDKNFILFNSIVVTKPPTILVTKKATDTERGDNNSTNATTTTTTTTNTTRKNSYHDHSIRPDKVSALNLICVKFFRYSTSNSANSKGTTSDVSISLLLKGMIDAGISMLICEGIYHDINSQTLPAPKLVYLSTGVTIFYPLSSFQTNETNTSSTCTDESYDNDFEQIILQMMTAKTRQVRKKSHSVIDITILVDNSDETKLVKNDDDRVLMQQLYEGDPNWYNPIQQWWRQKQQGNDLRSQDDVTSFSYCHQYSSNSYKTMNINGTPYLVKQNENLQKMNRWIVPVVNVYNLFGADSPFTIHWDDGNVDTDRNDDDNDNTIIRIKKKTKVALMKQKQQQDSDEEESTISKIENQEVNVENTLETTETMPTTKTTIENINDSADDDNNDNYEYYYVTTTDILKIFHMNDNDNDGNYYHYNDNVLTYWVLFLRPPPTMNSTTNSGTTESTKKRKSKRILIMNDPDENNIDDGTTTTASTFTTTTSSTLVYQNDTHSYFALLQQDQQQQDNPSKQFMSEHQQFVQMLEQTLSNLWYRSVVMHSCYNIPTGDDGTIQVQFVNFDENDDKEDEGIVIRQTSTDENQSKTPSNTSKDKTKFQIPNFFLIMTRLVILQERYKFAVQLLNNQHTSLLWSSSYYVPITPRIAQKWITARDLIHNGTTFIVGIQYEQEHHSSNENNIDEDTISSFLIRLERAFDCYNEAIRILYELRNNPRLSVPILFHMPLDQYMAILAPLVLPLLLPLMVTLVREIQRYRNRTKTR